SNGFSGRGWREILTLSADIKRSQSEESWNRTSVPDNKKINPQRCSSGREAVKADGEGFSARTVCVCLAMRNAKDSVFVSAGRDSRKSNVLSRSSRRRSTLSKADASQLRSGEPAATLMITAIHA